VQNFKSPVENGPIKVQQCYTGEITRPLPMAVAKCDASVCFFYFITTFEYFISPNSEYGIFKF